MERARAIETVKKLQALADAKRNPNAHERQSARRRMKALQRRYEITAAELKPQAAPQPVKQTTRKAEAPGFDDVVIVVNGQRIRPGHLAKDLRKIVSPFWATVIEEVFGLEER
jgi:hypothetical protein